MSGGWSTTPPRAEETPSRPPRPWWWAFLAVGVLAIALIVWQPWGGASPAAAPTGSPRPTSTEPSVAPSLVPPPLSTLKPDPSLTSTSNTVTRPPAPGQDTVFDATSAGALFVTTEQIAGALPSSVGAIAPSAVAPPGWGLPPGGSIVPASCQVARTVVATAPPGYEARDWVGGTAFSLRQEVTLLATPTDARRAFASLVGTVDACATYTEVTPGVGVGRWVTLPAVEGDGLYPSIVQQVRFDQTATRNGYRGHLLVGNAIVTWTAWTTDGIDTIGPPDSLAAIMQDRALAAVQAAG